MTTFGDDELDMLAGQLMSDPDLLDDDEYSDLDEDDGLLLVAADMWSILIAPDGLNRVEWSAILERCLGMGGDMDYFQMRGLYPEMLGEENEDYWWMTEAYDSETGEWWPWTYVEDIETMLRRWYGNDCDDDKEIFDRVTILLDCIQEWHAERKRRLPETLARERAHAAGQRTILEMC